MDNIPSEVLGDEQLIRELLEHESSASPNVKSVVLSTVKMYIAAVVDLSKDQSFADPHSYRPHPHGKLVEALKKSLKYEEQKQKRENYIDRGVGTIANGYSTTAEIENFVGHYFNKSTQEGLRNGVTFSLQHHGLLGRENLRMMELSDLQCMLLENEGNSHCYALTMIVKQGKTNQEGHLEFTTCLRNKSVNICPQMMLSLYLFYHCYITGEAFPEFNKIVIGLILN
jgi:hypothetical protein